MEPIYKRVLIKISGEALAGSNKTGFDFDVVAKVCETVKRCTEMGVEVGIVIGAGNFWRGVTGGAGTVERVSAEKMGMLGTEINSLAVADVFRRIGAAAEIQTAIDIQGVGERYNTAVAVRKLEEGSIVLFGCGTGCPFFSTDTAAVLRAAEIGADAILLAKNIDGVYSADPRLDPTAVKFDSISYDEALARRLAVMDSTATRLAMDNSIPVIVFALADPDNIVKVLCGENVGTTVTK